jgi:hypothetical protein
MHHESNHQIPYDGFERIEVPNKTIFQLPQRGVNEYIYISDNKENIKQSKRLSYKLQRECNQKMY